MTENECCKNTDNRIESACDHNQMNNYIPASGYSTGMYQQHDYSDRMYYQHDYSIDMYYQHGYNIDIY